MSFERQKLEVGKTIANLIHQSLAWEEALNSDDIVAILEAIELELRELNGEI